MRKTQTHINLKTQLFKEALKGLSLTKIVHHLPQFWRQKPWKDTSKPPRKLEDREKDTLQVLAQSWFNYILFADHTTSAKGTTK